MRYGYPKYVSVAEKRAKAERKLKALKKRRPTIAPVAIQGRTLARTFWGKSWNRNLEGYADYANRIERGRSYVRHGAVLDLQITPGQVKALVMGSTSSPYEVKIAIKPVPKTHWQGIKNMCQGKLDSLKQLMAGKFPKNLEELFTRKGRGLFPSPKEIRLDCSCPDWAVMCKHVAAVLYGVGARLDEDPSLLFVLRQAEVKELVAETVKESKKELLKRSKKRSSRIIEDSSQLSALFGVDLGGAEDPPLPAQSHMPPKPRAPKPRTMNTAVAKAESSPRSRSAAPLKRTPRRIKDAAGIETLFKRRTKRHTTVAELIEKSEMPPQKVRNILFRLTAKGRLERVSRGVYRWVR